MNRQAFHVYRPISQDASLDLMKAQASIARIVGTHSGSPLRLERLCKIGVDIVRPKTVENLVSASRMPFSYLRTFLKDDLPATGAKRIEAVVDEIFVTPKKSGSTVYIKLGSSILRNETVQLHESAIEYVGGVRPKFVNHVIRLAGIGENHADEVLDVLETNFLVPEAMISLDPICFEPAETRYQRAG